VALKTTFLWAATQSEGWASHPEMRSLLRPARPTTSSSTSTPARATLTSRTSSPWSRKVRRRVKAHLVHSGGAAGHIRWFPLPRWVEEVQVCTKPPGRGFGVRWLLTEIEKRASARPVIFASDEPWTIWAILEDQRCPVWTSSAADPYRISRSSTPKSSSFSGRKLDG